VGLFVGISDAGTIVPTGIGVSLIVTGTVLRLVGEQAKAASGQRPDFAGVMVDSVLCFVFLALHGWIASNVWATAQSIATGIYPDTKLAALAKLVGEVASKFKDYSFSIMGVGAALKDSAVVVTALFAWILTLLAHWQLEVLQVCVYNVVFAFAPVLIGLHQFGFNGRKIWFSAIVEVSSWSITMAVVYRSIDSTLFSYLTEASSLSFTNVKFLDTISMLVFLSSLPLIVPVVTGRLLGSQALGELGNATAGAGLTARISNSLRSRMPDGPRASPGTKGLDLKSSSPRPGDS
jgi:hypothetical protein